MIQIKYYTCPTFRKLKFNNVIKFNNLPQSNIAAKSSEETEEAGAVAVPLLEDWAGPCQRWWQPRYALW